MRSKKNVGARARRRGMTLAELMIVIGILGVASALVVWGCVSATAGEKQKLAAEAEVHTWAKALHLELEGVDCADIDSDGDGYVSCSVSVKGQAVQDIECRGAWSRGHGCRKPKPRVTSGLR